MDVGGGRLVEKKRIFGAQYRLLIQSIQRNSSIGPRPMEQKNRMAGS